jgi:hypothetical protein
METRAADRSRRRDEQRHGGHCGTRTGQATRRKRNLVEMNWDPITRIVGSLGIYTKIDFANARSPSATAPRRSSAATASS